jgi:capsular exopolysaccharide synthesis family protein
MSRDFELLRKAELGGKATRRTARRGLLFSEFAGSAGNRRLPSGSGPVEQRRSRESEWARVLMVVRKRWQVTLLFAVIVLCASAVAVFLIKPEYEPSARLEIDPPGSETFSMQPGWGSINEVQYLETHAQNLQTDDLAIAVIRKLGLDKHPDFGPKGSAESASVDPSRLTAAENYALRIFRSRLKVLHDPNSRVITVSMTAHDPQVAAKVTNTLVQTFVDRTLKMRHDAIAGSRLWLEGQLEGVRGKVEQANRDLAAFQKQTGVADIDEGRNTFGDVMAELNKQEAQVKSERAQLGSLIQKGRAGGVNSLPLVRENPVVQKLTQNLAEVRAQLAHDLVIYGVNHPNIKKLQSQADELEKQLAIQRKETLDQLQTSYEDAQAREKLTAGQKKEATATIGQMAEYNNLKKQAQAQAALYNSLLGRVQEAGIAAASQSSNIRVVDSARILDRPTRPHRVQLLGLGLLAGLFGGILLAFVRERLDRPLRTPEDVRDWTGIASVSVIPQFAGNRHRGLMKTLAWGSHTLAGPAKFLLERPHSPESEAVRSLNTNIVLANSEQPQAMLVTSALPGEGKTTVAVNLALALSQHGRTCLVDADLRRSSVAATFGIRSSKGLGDVLLGAAQLEDALVSMEDSPDLVILPAGPSSEERAHLVVSMAMKSVMTSLRAQFDFIVVDSAPIMPYADGRALSTVTDAIVFVTRSGITPAYTMARSMELLSEVKSAAAVKVVLNAHDFSARDYGSYYGHKKA